MDIYEEAVLQYISADKSRFVSPQFDIPYKNEAGGSCPDFVVIDFKDRTIYVVEVTSSSNVTSLTERIVQRDARWFIPLRKHLETINPIFKSWQYRVTAFVRAPNQKSLQQLFGSASDVTIKSIEEASFPYSWEWQGNEARTPLQ